MKKYFASIIAILCTLTLMSCKNSPDGAADHSGSPAEINDGLTADASVSSISASDAESPSCAAASVPSASESHAEAPPDVSTSDPSSTGFCIEIPYGADNITHSFLGTVLEESASYMIVEPAEGEEEREISQQVMIEYPFEHSDYLYGEGRRVVVYYSDSSSSPLSSSGFRILTDDISTEGFREFELSVESAPQKKKSLILSSQDLAASNPFPKAANVNLYYYGLSEVLVAVDGQTVSLADALRDGKITLNGIISKASDDARNGTIEELCYDDGGSSVFRYPDFAILKYHTLDGNRDVYIGVADMDINQL